MITETFMILSKLIWNKKTNIRKFVKKKYERKFNDYKKENVDEKENFSAKPQISVARSRSLA